MTQNRPSSHRRRATAFLLAALAGSLAGCATPTEPTAPSTPRADWVRDVPNRDGGDQPDTTSRSGYSLPHG